MSPLNLRYCLPSHRTPAGLFIRIMIIVALCESLVMLLLLAISTPSPWHILLDTILLMAIMTPLIHFLVIKPIQASWRQRIQARAQLREQQHNFQIIFDAAPVGMLLIDSSLTVIKANDIAARITRTTRRKLLNARLGQTFGCVNAVVTRRGCGHSPACRTCHIRNTVRRVMLTRQSVHSVDVQLDLASDGQKLSPWLQISVEPVIIDSANCAIVTMNDVTDARAARKHIEQLNSLKDDLLKPGNLHEKAQRITDAVVRIVDADFARIWVTQPGDRCDAGCVHAKLTTGPHVCKYRDRCLHLIASSGRYTHLDGQVHQRVPFGCYKIGRVAADKDKKFITNDVTHDPRVHNHHWAAELGLASFAGYRLLSSQNRPVGVLALFCKHTITPAQDALLESIAGTASQVICMDGTEVALRLSINAAEKANQSKSRFLANMSHEIRTPISAILGYTDLLMDPETGHEDRQNHLTVIHRNGQHLLTLINDILDLSKIEAGKMTIEKRPASIVSLLADVASIMRVRATSRRTSLELHYTGPVPQTILTDPNRVRQTLMNLVGNAIKFTENGSVRIITSFLSEWRAKTPAIKFDVIDTGIGISPEKMSTLFQPFVQADSSTSRKFGGTGLGLAISQHIAQLLDGKLTVASTPEIGSTFTFVIPTGPLEGIRMIDSPGEAVEQQIVPGHSENAQKTLANKRVLLAEDGPDNQNLVRLLLQKAGAQVDIAENGKIAVEEAAAKPFDIILMDMQMPEMDGYEATALLRQQGHSTPIIALTAHAMSQDRQKCLKAGCNDYLAKPIDRDQLIRTIAQHCGQSSPDPEMNPAHSQQDTAAESPQAVTSEFADDPDMLDVIRQFVLTLPDKLTAMRDALDNADFETLQRLAHQLKGAGGSYGYPILTESARTLENAARDKAHEDARLALASLSDTCNAVVPPAHADVAANTGGTPNEGVDR